jgi:hypothetical protein
MRPASFPEIPCPGRQGSGRDRGVTHARERRGLRIMSIRVPGALLHQETEACGSEPGFQPLEHRGRELIDDDEDNEARPRRGSFGAERRPEDRCDDDDGKRRYGFQGTAISSGGHEGTDKMA